MRSAALLALIAGAVACGGGEGGPDGGVTDGGGFNDHTVARIESREQFDSLAEIGPSLKATKFVITAFPNAEQRAVSFMESDFYTLHDEWYWFRLLNGHQIPGDTLAAVKGYKFDSIAIIYSWAREQKRQNRPLPLDLRWVNGEERLYSPRFYQLALGMTPRQLGLGSLIHVPARTTPEQRPEFWAFELEYVDNVAHADLVTFFQTLSAQVPVEIATKLKWLVRSPQQEDLALEMEAQQLEYHDRILRYSELIVPGEKQVYSDGLTAGFLRVVRQGEPLETTSPTDVLVLDHVPDFLPACAGLITAIPQTPLAHVAVLSRNRGIPNAYIGAVLDDPQIDQLARVRAPVILGAKGPNEVDLVPITSDEYYRYQQLNTKQPIAAPPVDLSAVQPTYDLAPVTVQEIDYYRSILGGKSANFAMLASAPNINLPDRPFAISIKPYNEHLAPLRNRIERMLEDTGFLGSAPLRFLTLEGIADYDARFPTAADKAFRDAVLNSRPQGDTIGDLIRAGGLRKVLRDQPIAASTLNAIDAALRNHFAHLGSMQALRFRSSGTLEDLDGFTAAGLYDSNTGYLNASSSTDPEIQKRTIEWAIKKTWGSYWSFEAFEERRRELIDHLSGNMGLLVHPRFDDDFELANGVLTITLLPENQPQEVIFEVNVQAGSESVTNPTPGRNALPEIDRLILDRGTTTPRIFRVQPSNIVPQGTLVLSDEQLRELYARSFAVAQTWLTDVNKDRPEAQKQRTLTLDLEFRDVAEGWPAMADNSRLPRRLVFKQVRSLDPELRDLTAVDTLPLPHDVLVRSRRIERRTCVHQSFQLELVEAFTDPLLAPDLGHSVAPFTASLAILFTEDALGFAAGTTVALDHQSFTASHEGIETSGWRVQIEMEQGQPLDRVEMNGDYSFTITNAQGTLNGSTAPCNLTPIMTTPRDYLLSLIAEKQR